MESGRIQQLATAHQEELQRYLQGLNATQGRMNHQLQVGFLLQIKTPFVF